MHAPIQISIYFKKSDVELYKALVVRSEKADRSLNYLVMAYLREGLKGEMK